MENQYWHWLTTKQMLLDWTRDSNIAAMATNSTSTVVSLTNVTNWGNPG